MKITARHKPVIDALKNGNTPEEAAELTGTNIALIKKWLDDDDFNAVLYEHKKQRKNQVNDDFKAAIQQPIVKDQTADSIIDLYAQGYSLDRIKREYKLSTKDIMHIINENKEEVARLQSFYKDDARRMLVSAPILAAKQLIIAASETKSSTSSINAAKEILILNGVTQDTLDSESEIKLDTSEALLELLLELPMPLLEQVLKQKRSKQ